jgi:hypothetical protein
LPAIVSVATLLTFGVLERRKHPALSFAILFYFVGHLIESTFLPLELYFEHRNYLPALPMFWPLAIWLTGLGPLPALRKTLSLLVPIGLAALTHERANLWGNPFEQAILFAEAAPNSPRAQVNAASYELHSGQPLAAIARLRWAIDRFPNEPQLTLNLIDAECATSGITQKTQLAVEESLRNNKSQVQLIHYWLLAAINTVTKGKCKGMDFSTLTRFIDAYRENPFLSRAPERQRDLYHLNGRLALAEGDAITALDNFNKAIATYPSPDETLLQAALLGSSGWPQLGLRHIEYYKTLDQPQRAASGMRAVHLWLLDKYQYWPSEFKCLEGELRSSVDKVSDSRTNAQVR